MTGYVSIGYGDLAFAAILLVVNAGLSLWLRLGLERHMLIVAAPDWGCCSRCSGGYACSPTTGTACGSIGCARDEDAARIIGTAPVSRAVSR